MNLSSILLTTPSILLNMFINYYTHDHCSIVSATGISINQYFVFYRRLRYFGLIETQLFFDKNINEYKN